jgi:hypothetical protein
MKNIESLSVDISKYGERVIDNLIKAQRSTARDLLKDVKLGAPVNTGAYRDSIQMTDTVYDGNEIRTSVYTDATVMDSLGREYNLGELIEYGTRPHLIEPATKQVLKFTIDGHTIFASHVFHPGTVANPHFQLALQKNIPLYQYNIRRALKEAEL